MKKFKDTNSKVHEIEEGFEHLLPNGATPITDEEAAELLALPPLTKDEYIQAVSDALQTEMDKDAQSVGYDNILTACSYAGEPSVAKFQNESKSFLKHRSKVWEYAYGALGQYEIDLAAYPDLLAAYETDKAQYDLDKAQYDIDIAAEPPLDPLPTEPTLPVAPNEVITPTIDEMVAGMPVRV